MFDESKCAHSATVLIVDDTPTNLQVLLDALENAGYDVLVASSGEEALQRAQLGAPDLILLDVVMPDMDGFETCRRLKAEPTLETVPVIFMTALTEISDKLAGFTAGGVDYITKPLDHDEALARVKTHLTIRGLQTALETQNLQLQAITQALTRFLQTDRSQEATSLLLKSALGQVGGQFGLVGLVANKTQRPVARVISTQGNISEGMAGQGFFTAMQRGVESAGHVDYSTEELETQIGPVISEAAMVAVPHTGAPGDDPLSPVCLSVPTHHDVQVTGFLAIVKCGGFSDAEGKVVQRFAQAAGVIFECERLRRRERESQQQRQRAEEQAQYLQEEIKTRHFDEIVGQSQALQDVLQQVERVAQTDSTVLIHGETGTGKELFARAIHHLSPRTPRPVISVSCAALPENLVESELFGHEKGAFTGATARRKGRFELADGGTLFLDEIGDMPIGAQTKLLRVLQEKELERLGGNQTIRVDVRVLAATHRDLRQLVAEGSFREDLYYRINVFPIELPPLRNRREDIPALVQYFTDRFAAKIGRSIKGTTEASLARLQNYAWPGNVRELENIIERAVILCTGDLLEVPGALLPSCIAQEVSAQQPSVPDSGSTVSEYRDQEPPPTLAQVERDYVIEVLTHTDWVIEGEHGAADILGITPSTLRRRMQKLRISKPSTPR